MDELAFNFHSGMWQIPTVHIATKNFEADAIEMYEMPHGQIIDMMSVFGPRQMFKMIDLFKLALTDQNKLGMLEILTFNEMSEVVGQWAAKSPVRWLEFGGGKNADEDNEMIDPPLTHDDEDDDEPEIIVSLSDIERIIDKMKEDQDGSSTEEADEPF
jgi:hypothetical protein